MVSAQSGPIPAVVTMSALSGQSFTYTYSAAGLPGGPGTLNFSFTVLAVDAVSGLTISSNVAQKTVLVQNPAVLSGQLVAISNTASLGNQFTLLLTVTNSGDATATNVAGINAAFITPQLTPVPVATLFSLNPSSQSIPGGASAVFTYIYTASSVAAATFSVYATGVEANTGAAISTLGTQAAVNVINQVTLGAAFAPGISTTVSTGQVINLFVNVTNTAAVPGATALGVVPSPLTQISTFGGAFTLSSGPVPGPQSIVNSNFVQYVFTFTATASGTVAFSGFATGTDQNTGQLKSSLFIRSPDIVIVNSAASASNASFSPALITPVQQMTVTLTVSNTGGTNWNAVTPQISYSPGTLNLVNLTPTALTLVPGAFTAFTWIYAPSATGTYSFTILASGTDAISGNVISSVPSFGTVIVKAPAVLASSLSFAPNPASTTQPLTLIMTVTNSGEADAVGVAPILTNAQTFFDKFGSAAVSLVSGPLPTLQTVQGLSTRNFTFTYVASGPGSVAFNGGLSGTDAVLGNVLIPPANLSNYVNVVPIAALSISLTAVPTSINLGGTITVSMQVINNGGSTANAVSVRSTAIAIGAGTFKLTGPIPASATIVPGGSTFFTYTYSATGLGALAFSSFAQGTDAYSGLHDRADLADLQQYRDPE